MSPQPKRVLITLTSAHREMYPGGHETGVFITEALHPFQAFRKAGFEVDLASENGEWYPDHGSLGADYLKGEDKEIYEDKSSEFRSAMDSKVMKAADVDASRYGVFFASAGHATLIDYPTAKGLQSAASKIWKQGGIVSAVCHGGAILPGVIDPDTGKSVINGRRVTGFTTIGEEQLGVMDTLKSWNVVTIEQGAKDAGATYVAPNGPWDEFSVVDGNLITGVNPQSAHKVAADVIEAFPKL